MQETLISQPFSVYVSYSRTDILRLERFVPALRDVGCRVMMDSGQAIDHFDTLAERLNEDIHACDVMVVALSPAAVESDWVQRETNLAQQLAKPIIPILLRAVVKLPDNLAHYQSIDLREKER